MKTDRQEVFLGYEPPPGGPARMSAKLAHAGRRRDAQLYWLGPVAVALIAVITVILFRPAGDLRPGPDAGALLAAAEFDRLLGRETEPLDLTVTRGGTTLSVSELETREPNVRVFRIDD